MRPTGKQMEALVDYMSLHLEFARDELDIATSNNNWEVLAGLLNNQKGAKKNAKAWKKVRTICLIYYAVDQY